MTKALIFDFDGVILETESPEFQAWQEIYQEHGCSLTLAKWSQCIGTTNGPFNVYDDLEEQLGQPLDRAAIRAIRRARVAELIAGQGVLPGVENYILDAKRLGLRLGLASSAARAWVEPHLATLGIKHHFQSIKCAEDVARTKPDPALYLLSLEALGVEAHEAIALEDSPNGVLAAKRAGIFCVAVPNGLTRQLAFEGVDMRLSSLEEMPLEQLLRHKSGTDRIQQPVIS